MNYVMDVAALFLARCRDISILGPIDFAIIAEWEKQEIPLAIILKSINDLCDEGANVESVDDFQGVVKQNFIDWLRAKEY